MKSKTIKRILCHVLVLAMLCSAVLVVPQAATKNAKPAKKSLTIEKGSSKTIKINNKKKDAVYQFTTASKKINVTAAGKVTALKAGTAKVTVKETYNKKTTNIGTVKIKVVKKGTGGSDLADQVENTIVYKNYFEDGNPNGFGPRGSCAVEITNLKNHTDSGQNSLYVTKRTANWNGATLSIRKLVEVGVPYKFSAWVMQDSGKTEKISMKLDYKDSAGTAYYGTIVEDQDFPSGKWVKVEAACVVPEYSGDIAVYFESSSSGTLSFYIDDVVITGKKSDYKGFVNTDENYEAMKEAGVFSTGNNARIKEVIKKARAGEDVTLAYIGGSITSGGNASPNSNCYAQVSAKKFAAAYGKDGGENVHFINAGMHGTPSDIGVVRYQRDIIGRLPEGSDHADILFIEFAVNDYGCATAGGGYEGLIRGALEDGSAVVLVFSVFQTMNRVCEMDYRKYGEHYDLPIVSMGNAIEKFATVDGFNDWYYSDNLHPNNAGHLLMADCIMQMIDKIDKEETEEDNIADVNAIAPVKTAAYQGYKMIDSTTKKKDDAAIISINAGGFSEADKEVPNFGYDYKDGKDAPWFADNWMHTGSSGKDPLKLKVNCSSMLIVYKISGQTAFGKADLYIDGKKTETLNCYDASGWNYGKVCIALNEKEAAEHTIELKMASGDENKKFTVMAIGYK